MAKKVLTVKQYRDLCQKPLSACNVQINFSSRYYSKDIRTHTGQEWGDDDYRLARFMNAKKHVNPNWAVELIAKVPPREVAQRVVWCDGGSGPEGHPRVYINLDKPGNHACGYCGLRFIRKEHV